jgi:hypothetical protein
MTPKKKEAAQDGPINVAPSNFLKKIKICEHTPMN